MTFSPAQQLEAALAAAVAAEGQREVWERAIEEARTTAQQLETRLQSELQQLALDLVIGRKRRGDPAVAGSGGSGASIRPSPSVLSGSGVSTDRKHD